MRFRQEIARKLLDLYEELPRKGFLEADVIRLGSQVSDALRFLDKTPE